MKVFKLIVVVLTFSPLLYSQTMTLSPDQLAAAAALATTNDPLPGNQVPPAGFFYSAQNLAAAPAPGNFFALPAWPLGSNCWLLDDLEGEILAKSPSGNRTMEDDNGPFPPGASNSWNGPIPTNSPYLGFDTNGLWLQMTGITNGIAYINLFNATDYVYEVFSTESLAVTNNPLDWNIEQAVFPATNQNPTSFTVLVGSRTNSLYFWARDWTGITENGNTTPDWWFFYWFGSTAFTDANLDSTGNTLLSDYQNGADPNVIYFAVNVTNRAFNTSGATVQITLSAGAPYSMATLLDSADPSTANWTAYNSNPVVNLGSVPGWHTVWVGLKGLPADAQQTWQQIQLKLVPAQPVLIVTSPAPGVVTQPFLQVQGYSFENLASISYDLSNSVSFSTNQEAFVTGRQFDLADLDYATNSFQCFDVPLANGANIITLHATDDAGNVASTNLVYILDPTANTNPPVMNVSWPQNNAAISGTSFPVRGTVNDPFATVTAQIINGTQTNNVTGLVEQNGSFWIENVPLGSGTNYLTVTATNTAGYGSATSLAVIQSSVTLTIGSVIFNDPMSPTATVSGTLAGSSDSVYVNGVLATNNGNGTWTAYYVPVGNSGTAAITAYAMAASGSGTADSQGANDTIRSPKIALVNCDWNSFQQYQWKRFNVQLYLPWYAIYDISYNETDNDPMHWAYGAPGYNLNTECGIEIGSVLDDFDPGLSFTNTTYTYILNNWDASGNGPCLSIGTNVCGATNGTTTPGAPASTFLPGFTEIADWQTCTPSQDLVTWQYLDHQRYALSTGGQAAPGQLNLWVIHVTAYRETPGQIDSPSSPIPPGQISVAGQTLDANGNVYLALPNNSDPIDITPMACSLAYTFTLSATEYVPQILANGAVLDPVKTNATFCAGQQMAFSANFFRSFSVGYYQTSFLPTNMVCNWALPATFVNSSTTNSAGCVVWTNNSSLLVTTNSPSAAWFVGGHGGAANVGASVILPNGSSISIAALGKFAIVKPAVTTFAPTDNSAAQVFFQTNLGVSVAASVSFQAFVLPPSNFYGTAFYAQLIQRSDIFSTQIPVIGCMQATPDTTSGEYWLDNDYPYPLDVPQGVSWNDNPVNFVAHRDNPGPDPGLFPFCGSIAITDQYKTYLQFQPVGGIPVTIGRIDWGWSCNATQTGNTWSWTLSTNQPVTDWTDSTLPVWTEVYKNN